uniref:Uncharacterized protein n=1 Tax=Panagrolaimus sp. PS1159 TaxID=55785 RepID=A0AC35EXX5_9BILA
MGKDYLKTIHGIVAIIQIILLTIGLFVCSFIWEGGNVYFLFYLGAAPAQIYILFALLITWAATIGVTVMQLIGQDILESMGKVKLIIYHGILLVILLIAAGLESYYVTWSVGGYHWRMIFDMIILWILCVTTVVQIIFVALQ